MFQNLLFTMSLAGSMVFILYILSYPLAEKYFSLKWRYRVLKIAAAFYLLPIPMCKYLIIDVAHCFFPGLPEKAGHAAGTMHMEYIIMVGHGFIKLSPGVRNRLFIVCFLGAIAFAIIQKRVIQYWKWKRVCSFGPQKPSDWEQELFTKVKKETGIKKDVGFICSAYCRSPMASGLFSPILIFPVWENKVRADKYEYMLRHELVHIKHHDLFIKYIGLLVMAVHWYNPLVYIMFREISVVGEMYCDSTVISGAGEEGRREYGNLILELAAQDAYACKETFFAGMAGSGSKNTYKRRILEMKRDKGHKVVLPVIMAMFLCMAGVMAAFVYDPPHTVSGCLEHDMGEDSYFITESADTGQKEGKD